eukprot:TRINITY_DN3719_c0_g2_i1.p1 TRINITY_DN3719_c0_g2~~TRINITY_DN3719_c0_g2_i1.p1  ORF type:complete len:107 (+),score=29.14 TRINITY_DN3719_c0_g2_i1:122-442(+)
MVSSSLVPAGLTLAVGFASAVAAGVAFNAFGAPYFRVEGSPGAASGAMDELVEDEESAFEAVVVTASVVACVALRGFVFQKARLEVHETDVAAAEEPLPTGPGPPG